MEPKIKVLKRHYIVKLGTLDITLPRLYRAVELSNLLVGAGYSVSIETIEHECEMTKKEIDMARAHDADIMILSEYSGNYAEPCVQRY